MASKVRGGKAFRRLLRQLPQAVRQQLVFELEQGGRKLLAAVLARAPRPRTGALNRGIVMRVYPRSLRLRVGLIGKRINQRLFYARILELGRKPKTVTVRRRPRAGGTTVSVYQMKVSGLRPRRFVYSPLTDLRATMNKRLKGVWDRALGRIAGGAND